MVRSTLVLAFALTLAACQPAAPEGPVTEGGDLDLGDLTLQSGEYYDIYTVRMQEDQWLSVNIQSSDFDPYLILGRHPASNPTSTTLRKAILPRFSP
ncbi:MAG: hypothetical protein Rubg2KO_40870 [Rubricoccaceae bacterium]